MQKTQVLLELPPAEQPPAELVAEDRALVVTKHRAGLERRAQWVRREGHAAQRRFGSSLRPPGR